jgi:integral membrane protein
MLKTALGRFRIVALAEGTSYLLLLAVAMPLKYMAGMPAMVTWVGWIHGLLFILYMLAGAHAAYERRWSLTLIAAAFIASLLPLATFYLDYWLRRQAQQEAQSAAALGATVPVDH